MGHEAFARLRHHLRRALGEGAREPAPHDRVGDRLHALRAHGFGALRPGLRGRQIGGGRHKDEALQLFGAAQRQRLSRHAAERQADHMRLGDAQGVQQPGEVVGQIFDGRAALDHLGAAMAARVIAEHAVPVREGADLRVPHLDGRAD